MERRNNNTRTRLILDPVEGEENIIFSFAAAAAAGSLYIICIFVCVSVRTCVRLCACVWLGGLGLKPETVAWSTIK